MQHCKPSRRLTQAYIVGRSGFSLGRHATLTILETMYYPEKSLAGQLRTHGVLLVTHTKDLQTHQERWGPFHLKSSLH